MRCRATQLRARLAAVVVAQVGQKARKRKRGRNSFIDDMAEESGEEDEDDDKGEGDGKGENQYELDDFVVAEVRPAPHRAAPRA